MKIYQHILRQALTALPMVGALLLAACQADDTGDIVTPQSSDVTVQLNVSAGQMADLNLKSSRAGGDDLADEHEFIHTLRVYIVSQQGTTYTTYMDLSPDLSANAQAQTGDLVEWYSDYITLPAGQYAVFAFANLERYEGQTNAGSAMTGAALLSSAFQVGRAVDETSLGQFRLYDPAGQLDFAQGRYIPMSGVATASISADLNGNTGTTVLSVPLDRLVSKVNLTLGTGLSLGTGSQVVFEGYTENVPLMASQASQTDYYGARTKSQAIAIDNYDETTGGSLSFYINETPAGTPFQVTLDTGSSQSGSVLTYTAQTTRAEVPRNHVYPLTLMFPDFAPVFNWEAWVSPIGNVPVEVEVNVETDTYTVSIPEGGQFRFSVTGMTNSGTLRSVTWTAPEQGDLTDLTISGDAITAALSAGVGIGTEIPLTVEVTWRASVQGATAHQSTLTRTYNVIIKTIDITDVEFRTSASYAAGSTVGNGALLLLGREYLTMSLTNNNEME